MRNPPWIFALVLLASSLCLCAAETQITRDEREPHPGIRCYTIISEYQRGPNKIEVLLPDDYTPTRQYPVVYLLPVNVGVDGPWGSGIAEARRLRLATRHQVICVAPSYEVLPWFGDNPEKPWIRQNSHLIQAVRPFIEKEFSVIPGRKGRWLIGFSKSGLGALGLFFRHLDVFDRVAVFDPAPGPPTPSAYEKWGFADTYGPMSNYDAYDPVELIRKYGPKLRDQPRRITIMAGGPGSRTGVDLIRSRIHDAGIPYVYLLGSHQSHDWKSGWLPFAFAAVAD